MRIEKTVILVVITCMFVLCCTNKEAYSLDSVTLGTGTPGGGFTLYGDTFAKVINAGNTPFLSDLRTRTEATRISNCSNRV